MAHLSSHGIPCPKPIANLRNEFLGELNGKPATIVTCLEGAPVLDPTPEHCARVGEVLAEMHLAGQTYRGHPGESARPEVVDRRARRRSIRSSTPRTRSCSDRRSASRASIGTTSCRVA